jgi:hypothetical protein
MNDRQWRMMNVSNAEPGPAIRQRNWLSSRSADALPIRPAGASADVEAEA